MNRRRFIKSGVAVTVAASLRKPARAQSTKPPNILYLFADQHRSSSVQALQSGTTGEQSDIYTPTLDTLRTTGFVMQNCISNYPLCSPHRAMLQTGIYPQKNGVTGNVIIGGTTAQQNNVVDLNTSTNTGIAQILFTGANYYSGYIGKWDLFADTGTYLKPGDANRFGYNEWMVWFNTNSHYVGGGANPAAGTAVNESNSAYTYTTLPKSTTGVVIGTKAFVFPYSSSPTLGTWNPHCMTLQAQDFLTRNASNSQPWILFLSYNVPHPPYNPPNGKPPAQTSNGYHYYNENATPVFRSNVDGASTGGLPDSSLNQVRTANDPPGSGDPTQNGADYLQGTQNTENAYWNYYEGVSDVDTEFGMLINQINNDPNTLIIYSSDHGDMLGSHTLGGKQYPHEESNHVPFYVGGSINGAAIPAASYTGLFASIDIVPTLCGLAGVTPPNGLDGKNFANVIKGKVADVPNPSQYVFLLNGHGDPANGNGDSSFDGYYACPVYRGLRSSRYTYAAVATNNLAWFQDVSPATQHTNVGPYAQGHWVLFDNQLDPYQQNNLIVNGQYPLSTPSQPVPAWSDLQTALLNFIAANGNKAYGPDAFVSPVTSTLTVTPTLKLTPSQTTTILLGAPITVTAAVSTTGGGAGPTGSIMYSVDGGTSTYVALAGGGAQFILSGLSELQHTVSVTYSGDGTYATLTQTLTLNGNVSQSIVFPPLANVTFTAVQTVALSARATSGELVTYIVSGPATLNASTATLTLTGTGTVSVTASAAANASFTAAAPVTRSFLVQ